MDEEDKHLPAMDLMYNVKDIMNNIPSISFSHEANLIKYPQPNMLRSIGGGKPMFRIRVTLWSDDVSGNQSKQYNAHTNTCIVNLNIPHRVSAQEFFVRFCSTSQHASSSEQLAALVNDL